MQEGERAAWSQVWVRTGLASETELLCERNARLGWDARKEMVLCRLVTYRYSSGNSLDHPDSLLHLNHVVPWEPCTHLECPNDPENCFLSYHKPGKYFKSGASRVRG